MVSKSNKEHDRRSKLCEYLYGVSSLFISGTGIGGLSPLFAGGEMGVYNYVCIIAGALSAITFACFANDVMKYNDNNI